MPRLSKAAACQNETTNSSKADHRTAPCPRYPCTTRAWHDLEKGPHARTEQQIPAKRGAGPHMTKVPLDTLAAWHDLGKWPHARETENSYETCCWTPPGPNSRCTPRGAWHDFGEWLHACMKQWILARHITGPPLDQCPLAHPGQQGQT